MSPRIDTHQHIVPPRYRQWLMDQGFQAGGVPTPTWDSQGAITMMDAHGIESSVLPTASSC